MPGGCHFLSRDHSFDRAGDAFAAVPRRLRDRARRHRDPARRLFLPVCGRARAVSALPGAAHPLLLRHSARDFGGSGGCWGASPKLIRGGLATLAAIMILSIALGAYHAGVEWKFWGGPHRLHRPDQRLRLGRQPAQADADDERRAL